MSLLESIGSTLSGCPNFGLILITEEGNVDTSNNPIAGPCALAALAAYSSIAVAASVAKKKIGFSFVCIA